LALDRFVPLRFRAIAATDHTEDVKWLNVFQEASFSLDRTTGRCTGTVTWTDKLIQSMDCGFFRLLDASRYMELDGITAKHLYRYLATTFEKTPLLVIDARTLSRQHLGILNPPKYLSRLMQTLEPAFDQLIRIQVLGSYHVVSHEDWTLALHRHASYVPESNVLLQQQPAGSADIMRAHCLRQLERAGMPPRLAASYSELGVKRAEFLTLERAAWLLDALREEDVLPHVALSLIRKALDASLNGSTAATRDEGRELLDWCEIAVEVCRHKKRAGQQLKNPAGFLIKLVKDVEARARFVSQDLRESRQRAFRQREEAALRQQQEAEEQSLILEYEQFRQDHARQAFNDLPDSHKKAFRKEKEDLLRQQERFERIPAERRQQEADELILQELARREAPSFDKWYLRRRAQQALLPFETLDETAGAQQERAATVW
jgi:hypothetical protein